MIKVNWKSLVTESQSLKGLSNNSYQARTDIDYVKSQVSSKVQQRRNISTRLSSAKRKSRDIEEEIKALYGFLDYAAASYQNCDKYLSIKASEEFTQIKVENGYLSREFGYRQVGENKSHTLLKEFAIGKMIVGSANVLRASSIMNPLEMYSVTGAALNRQADADDLGITSDYVQGWALFGKGAIKIVEKGASDNFEKFLGVNDLSGSFSTNISKDLGKYANGGSQAVVKWVGVGLTGVTRGMQNLEEYNSGEIDAARAAQETVMEVAVSVGTDIIIKSAATALTVTAAAAITTALGLTAAPAIAVGAVAFGVGIVAKMGLDSMAKAMTGGKKDFVEATSDLILDTREKIGDAFNDTVKATKDSFNNLVNCFVNPIKIPKLKFGF